MKKNNIKSYIINVLMIVFGTSIMAVAFNIFLVPNNISPSGFSGLAAILTALIGKTGIYIPESVFYLGLNMILYVFAYKIVGKQFAIYAIIGILSFSITLEISNLINYTITGDLLVCALYGGFIFGFGTGLVLRYNGSTGGSDMLASIIRSRSNLLSTGQIIMICNVVVLALSVLVYGANSLLYSIITIFIASQVTDIVINGAKGVRAYYIISDKKDELSEKIYSDINRGLTAMKITGVYSKKEKNMLLCLINKYSAPMLKKIVYEIDPNAFIFSTSVADVVGRGFYMPDPKKNKKYQQKISGEKIDDVVEPKEVIDNTSLNLEENVPEKQETKELKDSDTKQK